MKGDWEGILGRTIDAVITQESSTQPKARVILHFSDGAYFEMYSSEGDVRGTNNMHPGTLDETIATFARQGGGELKVYRSGE